MRPPFVIRRWERIEHLSAQKFALAGAGSDFVDLIAWMGLNMPPGKLTECLSEMGLKMPSKDNKMKLA